MSKETISIQFYKSLAITRNGRCLSNNYINSTTKLKWQCEKGHIWEALPINIKKGSWCPYCVGKYQTIKKMQQIAKNRGGKCLSAKYINSVTKLRWQCKEGHLWEATPMSIKQGSWCPTCANLNSGSTQKLSINEMKNLAKEKKGKCLSKEYINSKTKLKWKCDKGHIWETTPLQIKSGSWCPVCAIEKNSNRQKLSINEMHDLAKEKNGKCLSKKYINTDSKLRWKCSNGHVWEATPYHIKSGQWCPYCAGKLPLTIKDMKKLAKMNNGKCLSDNYINAKTKLKWKCREGHIWEATPDSVKSGHWCPYCIGRHQAIEDMQSLAEKKKGKCLSIKYINNNTKLKWQCEKGHIWMATPGSVKSGTWCPVCAKNIPSTIEEMKEIAKNKGGKCLSRKYINTYTELKWKCKEGHIWKASPSSIKYGRWCPICTGKTPITIEEMHEIAELRGGKCLSSEYINIKSNLKWQCHRGHIWETAPINIKKGQWCPICSIARSERICRLFFEKIFNKKFPKKRPKWLKNIDNNQMELDGYCKEIRLAFEHHGDQHYYHKKFFHPTVKDFKKRIRDDKHKEKLCKQHNVFLVVVPDIQKYIKIEKLKDFILDNCTKIGFKDIPDNINDIIIDYKEIYTSQDEKELSYIKKIAEEKNGKCLSEYYLGSKVKLSFQCQNGHIWDAVPSTIKKGSWCPYCATRVKSSIEDMQKIAEDRGGKCLSLKYTDSFTKLKWQCKEGHIWDALPAKIKRGQWCPYCATTVKSSIEDMQKLANKRNGKCLSTEYINTDTKLKWQCHDGHIWKATPANIKRGRWCPICAKIDTKKRIEEMKLTIEEMQKIANSHGGKCLSEEYINSKTNLKWQCKEGHVWEAAPTQVKEGSWCPVCYNKIRGNYKKLTIEEMQDIAKRRKGKCLSTEYKNARTKLKWKCSVGHIWEAIPDNIKKGHWCPVCAKTNRRKEKISLK